MSVQLFLRRSLAGLVIIASALSVLALGALADGWSGIDVDPALQPWLLPSPLPTIWTVAIVLWTLVIVAILVSDDRAPRRADNGRVFYQEVGEAQPLALSADEAAYVRLGRGSAERRLFRIAPPNQGDQPAA
jgi:hypothetical protein